MSKFLKIAEKLNKAGITATVAAERPVIVRDAIDTAYDKIIKRLNDSVVMLDNGEFDAKRACYSTKRDKACVGIKYGNAYITFDDGNKYVIIDNDNDAIKATLNALIDAVENREFEAEIEAAAQRQQTLSKARYAKRKTKNQARTA
jgi:hypothetical protein